MRLYEKFLERSMFILGIMIWMHITEYILFEETTECTSR